MASELTAEKLGELEAVCDEADRKKAAPGDVPVVIDMPVVILSPETCRALIAAARERDRLREEIAAIRVAEAKDALREGMRSYSGTYFASWLDDAEYKLWGYVLNGTPEHEADTTCGRADAWTQEATDELHRLAVAADGWWADWDEFVPLPEWVERYRAKTGVVTDLDDVRRRALTPVSDDITQWSSATCPCCNQPAEMRWANPGTTGAEKQWRGATPLADAEAWARAEAEKIVDVDPEFLFVSVQNGNGRYLVDCGNRDNNKRLRRFVSLAQNAIASALLAAVRERPITVDGVPLRPAMRVWRTSDATVIDGERFEGWKVREVFSETPGRWKVRVCGGVFDEIFHANCLYSTYEAALAASKEGA